VTPATPDQRIEPSSIVPAASLEGRVAQLERELRHDRENGSAERKALQARVAKLEVDSKPMRARMKSIDADVHAAAEDTARHEIRKLREELAKTEAEKAHIALQAERDALIAADRERIRKDAKDAEDIARMAIARRKVWSQRLWSLLVGIVLLLAGHEVHRLGH
jgi:hypothetical protein